MLRTAQSEGASTQQAILKYIGKRTKRATFLLLFSLCHSLVTYLYLQTVVPIIYYSIRVSYKLTCLWATLLKPFLVCTSITSLLPASLAIYLSLVIFSMQLPIYRKSSIKPPSQIRPPFQRKKVIKPPPSLLTPPPIPFPPPLFLHNQINKW